MSQVIDFEQARTQRVRARLEQDIERLLDRYAEQYEAARALAAQEWGVFFHSLALEWVGQGRSVEELKSMICEEIDATGVGR